VVSVSEIKTELVKYYGELDLKGEHTKYSLQTTLNKIGWENVLQIIESQGLYTIIYKSVSEESNEKDIVHKIIEILENYEDEFHQIGFDGIYRDMVETIKEEGGIE
jgi:hypothetical protein